MSKILLNTKNNLRQIISQAINDAIKDNKLPETESIKFNIEMPADTKNGDFSSNVAMVNAKNFKMAPAAIAKIICEYLNLNKTLFDKVEIAGPGFINFFFSKEFYSSIIDDVLKLKENYGKSDFGQNKKVMVEFVSANPTGPMHMGNARGGALGDCLAAVLDTAGYDVKKEFYINDAGNQIEKFGISLEARYLQILDGEEAHPLPEDSYHGEDIKDLANEFILINGDSYLNVDPAIRQKALIDFALPKNINKMKTDLEKYRIEFDRWFHEIDLHNNGEIDETIEVLKANDMTYEMDGALWYKATKMGSEKDEVLIRKNGNPTYFAADIAYHRNKFLKRGFDTCIDIWGADHHGHVARMKGAMDAIGLDGNKLDVILMQLVKLVKDGQIVRMSKRTGKAIQLADLLDEVSVDAARFIFNMREANSQMDFDLDLAVKEDAQNPVYYVQYAHARICSILKALEKENIYPKAYSKNEAYLLNAVEEKELIKHLSIYTNEIIESAKTYDPARITRYVITLATLFHKFYNACRVHCDDEDLMYARLNLCICVKIVISNILSMFKISVPESM